MNALFTFMLVRYIVPAYGFHRVPFLSLHPLLQPFFLLIQIPHFPFLASFLLSCRCFFSTVMLHSCLLSLLSFSPHTFLLSLSLALYPWGLLLGRDKLPLTFCQNECPLSLSLSPVRTPSLAPALCLSL